METNTCPYTRFVRIRHEGEDNLHAALCRRDMADAGRILRSLAEIDGLEAAAVPASLEALDEKIELLAADVSERGRITPDEFGRSGMIAVCGFMAGCTAWEENRLGDAGRYFAEAREAALQADRGRLIAAIASVGEAVEGIAA